MSETIKTPQPAFDADIPSTVRFCPDLPANAKLLYGEIAALCNKEGYCWAKNEYFAELYQKTERTIRQWLAALEKQHFIRTVIEEDERRIYLTDIADVPQKSRDDVSDNEKGGTL